MSTDERRHNSTPAFHDRYSEDADCRLPNALPDFTNKKAPSY